MKKQEGSGEGNYKPQERGKKKDFSVTEWRLLT
jgi:hypothetical protein